jgi:DNA invertase Pin-like site-specific DNA recombinase
MSLGPSEWFKKAHILGYGRISTAQQDTNFIKETDPAKKPVLMKQVEETERHLKQGKLPKPKEWFLEVESGTRRDRPKWQSLLSRAHELVLKGKKVVVVVKEPSRWSRNARHGLRAIDDLHEIGVPVLAAREGIQTGSLGDLHPTEELLFLQLSGSSAFVSQEQKKKADTSVEVSKELGIMAGKGSSLYPFAKKEPITLIQENIYRITQPKNEGGWSKAKLHEHVSDMSSPNGPSVQAVKKLIETLELNRKKLNDAEYREWLAYRNIIRNILIERGHDPFARTTDEGTWDWASRALMRMVGRYIAEPWKYSQRSMDEIQSIIDNYEEHLSGKDVDKLDVENRRRAKRKVLR